MCWKATLGCGSRPGPCFERAQARSTRDTLSHANRMISEGLAGDVAGQEQARGELE